MLGLLLCFSSSAFALEDLYQLSWLGVNDVIASDVVYPQAVNEIYTQYEFNLIWHDTEASNNLEALLQIMHHANLSPFFSKRLQQLTELKNNQLWYKYDIIATDTVLNFNVYIKLVQNNGFDWYYGDKIDLPHVPPSNYTIEKFIAKVQSGDLANYINSLNGTPDQMEYVQQSVDLLTLAIEQGLAPYRQTGVLKKGQPITNKPQLVDRLRVVGLDTSGINIGLDIYDHTLMAVVMRFQKMHGIKADGVIGKQTLYWINLPLEYRLHKIALNTERSRLMPRNLENTVIVNLPSFKLFYWYNGRPEFSTRVIIGKKKRKTPLLRVKMDTLIMNPSWNVPRKLVREDIIPLIKKDDSYLERMNMKIVKNWRTKEEIDPMSIDWPTIDPKTFSYDMTQAPGKHNALGEFKFNTPNARAIFLHDTPSKYLFNKSSRAYSSGCIRVQHASKLAEILMNRQGITVPQQSNTEPLSQNIALRQQIPVHILYQTAWIENGLVQYREDVYGYDKTFLTKIQ